MTETEKPVLAIGDVQGHLDRLEGLLLQEGVLGPCDVCAGSGDVSEAEVGPAEFCPNCKGVGSARVNRDVTVVQLGDLIDARPHTQTQDSLCVNFGEAWLDYVLWGNHDRPVVDPNPGILFGGYMRPLPEVVHVIQRMRHEGRFRLAMNAHGFLLVHAGLPVAPNLYEALEVDPEDPTFGEYLERLDVNVLENTVYNRSRAYYEGEMTPEIEAFMSLRDNISYARGGGQPHGGLLWRDFNEPLYPVRQVFCHSSAPQVRQVGDPSSYCLDLSKHGALGAIWLPEERVVEYRP